MLCVCVLNVSDEFVYFHFPLFFLNLIRSKLQIDWRWFARFFDIYRIIRKRLLIAYPLLNPETVGENSREKNMNNLLRSMPIVGAVKKGLNLNNLQKVSFCSAETKSPPRFEKSNYFTDFKVNILWMHFFHNFKMIYQF